MTDYITTEEDFDNILSAARDSDLLVVVNFTAPRWCVPCQRFEPHWEKVRTMVDETLFFTVDMGSHPEDTIEHWATGRFSILGVPTVKAWTPVGLADVKSRAVVPLYNELRQLHERRP